MWTRRAVLLSIPHAALCVSGPHIGRVGKSQHTFQCRTQHCVCRDSDFTGRSLSGCCFNAARSIVCVGTLCPAALVPRGLRRRFGKTRFFAPFLASADEICPEKREIHRRCPLYGAGCTVLERRNGGMRLCTRAGALSISFSSIIAHASFFFNDVFARVGGQMFSKKSMASVMLYMSLMDVCPLILSSLSRLHCA